MPNQNRYKLFQNEEFQLNDNVTLSNGTFDSTKKLIIDDEELTAKLRVMDFYNNKTIFITGCSGFIGKILLEKLIRMGNAKKIYVLFRPKLDKKAHERLTELLTHSPVFSFHGTKLNLDIVEPINGDLTKPNLGISDQDLQHLTEQVNVVFHAAASVQFKGNLKIFLEQNVRGTDHIMQLCQRMVALKSVIYVSTAYANCHLYKVEEKVYPFDHYQEVDEFIKEIMWKYGDMTPKEGHPVLHGRFNCYTFSKALAEWLVVKKYSKELPVTICRPSIVTHSLEEPVKGWCDTKNGVSGAMILGGLGIARSMILNNQCKADVIPVDFVSNSLIVIAAHTATLLSERNLVYHLTTGSKNPLTWGELLDWCQITIKTKPFLKQIRPLASKPVVSNNVYGRISHEMTKIFSHYCFALFADCIVMLCGHRPFLWKITKRMHQGFDTLQPFTSREWEFVNENYCKIYEMLSEKEQKLFCSDVTQIDWFKYIDDSTLGTRKYLLKEDDSTIERAIRRQRYLNQAYRSVEAIIYFALFAIIWWNIFYLYT